MNDEAQPLADTYAERRLSRAGARRHTGANAALAALVLGLMAVFAVYDAVFGAGEVEAAVAKPAAHRKGVGAAVGGLSGPLHRIASERIARMEVGARAIDEPLGNGKVALPHAPVQRRRAVACARVRVEAARD